MFRALRRWLAGRPKWPSVSANDARGRARLLVIDDKDFPYLDLLRRDGYNVTKWHDVDDLPRLERGDFDLILLDIHGVGREYSRDQGLGILEHLRDSAPAVILIAYSDAQWSLEYKKFFDRADTTLYKGADYVDFKRRIDELLDHRFSLDFYLERIERVLASESLDRKELREVARGAILGQDADRLREYLSQRAVDDTRVSLALDVAQTGIALLQLLAAL